MTAPSDNSPSAASLRERATDWRLRLASDTADGDDWLAFEAWLAESPDHLAAYEAVERVWNDLDEVPATPASRRTALWLGPIAAGFIAAVVLGVSVLPDQPQAQSYQTAFGERRSFNLDDGSRMTLNGGSRVAVSLGQRERRVFMAEAEAAFDVAQDPSRPFIIQAADREIRVVGTEFNVLRRSGEVHVTVRRGVVEVRPSARPQAAPLARLTPGQRLSHREGRAEDVIGAADLEAAFAWTEGG